MPLPIIRHDRAMHAVYGNLIAGAGALAAILNGWALAYLDLPLPPLLAAMVQPWVVALACTAGIGMLKEWRDGRGHGTRDKRDAIATILGGLPVVVVCMLLAV
jgi:uncharacterized protein YceK